VTLIFEFSPGESNQVIGSGWASEYSLSVSAELFMPFVRYRGNELKLVQYY